MKRFFVCGLALAALVLSACTDIDVDPQPITTPLFGAADVADITSAMTLEEKVDQKHGLQFSPIEGLYWTPDNERLQIPGFRMVDGPRGVRAGKASAFPVAAARAATWNIALEKRVGEAIGAEASAKGANLLLAPTINVLRHPAWGRAQETYGEDPFLIAKMGVAFVQGAQTHVLACAKHFAANSIEDTRFDVDVHMDERALREVYLPHFQSLITEGKVAVVMTAYNQVNGFYASENQHLLRDILKGEWHFDGVVVSDWFFGTHSTVAAAAAGLDIEMPSASHFGPKLIDAVNEGEIPEVVIDDSVKRILIKKLEAAAKPTQDATIIESEEHHALAREVSVESMVLLKNQGDVLPIDPNAEGELVIVGELAGIANLGDLGSSAVTPTVAITPLDGIVASAGNLKVTHLVGPTLTAEDHDLLASAHAAIVVVGLTTDDEGEGFITKGGDRETLALSPEDEAKIQEVAAHAERTIVVLEGGSAIVVRPWVDQVDSLLMAFYPGMEGGLAIADVLFGTASPGGKLPTVFPRAEADLPLFDHTSLSVEYGLLHGYRFLEKNGTEPEFPFGFGLSFTTFSIKNLKLETKTLAPNATLTFSVDVTNTGARPGSEVVQAYIHAEPSQVERAPRDLKAFAKVFLDPDETKNVKLTVPTQDLGYFDVAQNQWVIETTSYALEVGSSSRNLPLKATFAMQ